MNHFNNSVSILLLPNLLFFIRDFILGPISLVFNLPGGKKFKTLKDFIRNTVLNQLYVPYLGLMSLKNPKDSNLKDDHWEMKVMFNPFQIEGLICKKHNNFCIPITF